MKRVFLTTAALVLSVGAAAAEVSVSGDGRFGVKYEDKHFQHTSRARVKFKLEEKADNGVTYGGSFRAHEAGGANKGAKGDIYASGSFGKISFGDIDSASKVANGEKLHAIDLEDQKGYKFPFFGEEGVTEKNPGILYEYSFGKSTIYASLMDGDAKEKTQKSYEDAKAVGAKHETDRFIFGLGLENGTFYEKEEKEDGDEKVVAELDHTRTTLSLVAKLDSIRLKGMFSTGKKGEAKTIRYGGSAKYTKDAFAIAAYVRQDVKKKEKEISKDVKTQYGGIGASYDLNKHATVEGGISIKKKDGEKAKQYADFGLSLKF